MNDIVNALAEWRNESISREQFQRRLLAYENWLLPKREGNDVDSFGRFTLAVAQLIPDEKGQPRIFLFSDADGFEIFAAQQVESGGAGYSNPTGWEIFSADLGGVTAVVIDPGAPHEFVIEGAQFANLKELADAVGIEEVWQRLREGNEEEDDVSRAARYSAYHLAAVGREGGDALVYVPNDDGSRVIPIFTYPDALALALGEFRENFAPGEIKTLRLSGAQMFPVLAQQEAEGVVFNYKGPSEPAAFKLSFTDLMLEELAK
jgi:hypothetical protein